MHNISKLIRENKVEAYNLLKDNFTNGLVGFASDVIQDDFKVNEKWDGDLYEHNLPWAVLGTDNGVTDAAILAVRMGNEDTHTIECLLYDNDNHECIGWHDDAELVGITANEVYERIGEVCSEFQKDNAAFNELAESVIGNGD